VAVSDVKKSSLDESRAQKGLGFNLRSHPLDRAPATVEEDAFETDYVFNGQLPFFIERARPSAVSRDWKSEQFYSDKSRIVFCSSFRRMMQKAQVFSLESNTSVRNRLTHSLEVADIGRTLARHIGKALEEKKIASADDTECMQSIVENACLLHDIGNPPFGHFGEEAIKRWFRNRGSEIFSKVSRQLALKITEDTRLNDFLLFDGNPQGFRIATQLHSDLDRFSLNLTYSTLLASVKYPNSGSISRNAIFPKKLGVFTSEADRFRQISKSCKIPLGRRYFLAYVMELADDICYCLSDIADSFEKGIISSRDFKEEFRAVCKEHDLDVDSILPKDKIQNFGYQVSIWVSRKIIKETASHFSTHIEKYISGTAKELSEDLPSGKLLKCFKAFARRFIYTNHEAQRIEIAGSQIVEGLLNHFGRLLELPRAEFAYFVERGELRKYSGLDTEWRIFNQLSKRMVRVYQHSIEHGCDDEAEWICRARLIVDYVSGLTDNSALRFYQNFMGIIL